MLGLEPFEIEHDGNPVWRTRRGYALEIRPRRAPASTNDIAEALGQGDEIALRIDQRLLTQGALLFEKPAAGDATCPSREGPWTSRRVARSSSRSSWPGSPPGIRHAHIHTDRHAAPADAPVR